MSELESFPRDDLLRQLGLPVPKKRRPPPPPPAPRAPVKRRSAVPPPRVQVPQLPPERKRGPAPRFLPDLSTLPPAKGRGFPNERAKKAARKEYEANQADKAGQKAERKALRQRKPKENPGRPVPRNEPTMLRAWHRQRDAY